MTLMTDLTLGSSTPISAMSLLNFSKIVSSHKDRNFNMAVNHMLKLNLCCGVFSSGAYVVTIN